MIPSIKPVVDRARMLKDVAPDATLSSLRSAVVRRTKRGAQRVKRRFVTGQVKVVQLTLGPAQANRYFWMAPASDHTWLMVQRRIQYLADRHPAHADDFVEQCIARTGDPVSIVGLARHPFARDALRSWLQANGSLDDDDVARRLRENRLLGGAFAGAARVLLDRDEARAIADRVNDLYQIPDSRLLQFIDSVGWRPNADDDRGEGGGVAEQVRHRLIIAEHSNDPESIALLLAGAAKSTFLATSDTYGRADLSAYADWPGVGDIVVEHTRSRITRFSQEYIDLHEASRRVGRTVSSQVETMSDLLDSADRPVIAVEIADFMFFQMLKVRAVEVLLEDPSIDHVVLAIADQGPGWEFLRSMAGVSGLLEDRRLEIVSISRSAAVRARFWNTVAELSDPRPTPPVPRLVPEALVLRKFDEDAQRLAEPLYAAPRDGRRRVCVVTTNNGAYNESTAAYVQELGRADDVQIVHMGGNARPLRECLEQVGESAADVQLDCLAPAGDRFGPLSDLVWSRLEQHVPEPNAEESPQDRVASWVLKCSMQRVCRSSIAPALGRLRTLEHWFRNSQVAGIQPDVIVMTPQRNMPVAGVATVARRFGVPTISIEPHVQDANYSRYVKIASDFYGVVSDYFRLRAATGFGMDPDRTFTIGSPRLVAPADYDPDRARSVAREEFAAECGVVLDDDTTHLVYFCQPSDWSHVTTVWSSILVAARANGSRVLLKTHPEESVSRTRQYLEQAAAAGMADQVILLDCDASTAIDLGDLVLTAYSTAGIDAALRQRPVICVTIGEDRYPVDLEAIVDATVATSADHLASIIADFRTDPQPMLERARALIARETQFVEGPGERLRSLVADVADRGCDAVRKPADVPQTLFLDGPHPVYPV